MIPERTLRTLTSLSGGVASRTSEAWTMMRTLRPGARLVPRARSFRPDV